MSRETVGPIPDSDSELKTYSFLANIDRKTSTLTKISVPWQTLTGKYRFLDADRKMSVPWQTLTGKYRFFNKNKQTEKQRYLGEKKLTENYRFFDEQ